MAEDFSVFFEPLLLHALQEVLVSVVEKMVKNNSKGRMLQIKLLS